MRRPIRIAVIGMGKIAHDQHLPVIANSPDFELVAAASPAGTAGGVPNFLNTEALLASEIAFDAVALCQPPQWRFHAAALALRAGKHVLLEKPPAASTLEVDQLLELAGQYGKTLFAAWHSRYAPGVEPARRWLAQQSIERVRIEWREDVRQWHPGQAWIWDAGGFGVWDPGINALSILTHLIPQSLRVIGGTLEFPSNCQAPIGAQLSLATLAGVPIEAMFDWRHSGAPLWSLSFETPAGQLQLLEGGAVLQLGEQRPALGNEREYEGVYRHFAALVHEGRSEVDNAPLRLIADAFMRCHSQVTDPFH